MQRLDALIVAVGALGIVGLVAAGVVLYEPHEPEATVVLYDGEERVATIDAEVADDGEERMVGLQNHESLPADEGMLFVYDSEQSLTYHMPNMDFGIDIVYVDGDGCVTSVNPAPEPGPGEDGSEQEYPGHGQYVVEVPIGVASDAGVEAGDPVRIEYDGTTVNGSEASCFES